ncbi:MAG TPA: cytochrome c oxidase subunit II [Gemmatimonadaceae bacterium]|jgi:cytochrome c oxidase subunit 2|nr:cytochrome c oxidase subunit II [Gemmatimonadaceae bacterium]
MIWSIWSQRLLDAHGPQSGRIAPLMWFIIIVSAIVYVIVMAVLALAIRRGRRRAAVGELADRQPATERRLTRGIVTATAASAVLLLIYIVASASTGRAIAWPRFGFAAPVLTVEVTGHQWWWEFRYRDSVASRSLTTSNELHIPVGRPVQLVLESTDVIHSFWIPELHGKQDMIPGRQNSTWLQADRPGVWKAQCAEYCGHQHAKMLFDVIAESPERFAQWYTSQLVSAREPTDSSARRGRDVFMQGSCIMCHAINGTPAGSRVGPDLTHVASRPSIAAGTLPNTRGHLAGWIVDPQRIKPGARMPANQLSPADLNALLDYLQTLR